MSNYNLGVNIVIKLLNVLWFVIISVLFWKINLLNLSCRFLTISFSVDLIHTVTGFVFFFFNVFSIYLTVIGLSCHMWELGSSSLTRD